MSEYIYIIQAEKERSWCKIGLTDDLDRRLKEYNSITGKSADNSYSYLYTCEVSDSRQLENDIKKEFGKLRETSNREIFFYNKPLFQDYIEFIKAHSCFIKEIETSKTEPKAVVKFIKRDGLSLEERGLNHKGLLQKAKKVDNDEFYTRYEDVEKELSMYPIETWNDKTVFCNCDDAVDDDLDERRTSAFALYFIRNFNRLNLKKLICTHYAGGIDLFNQGVKGYIFTKEGMEELKITPKNYSGSFDDSYSKKILKEEADIVCTNPPFSKAIEYWDLVVNSGKQFIIISNIAVMLTTAYLHYFKKGLVWAGYNRIDWYWNPKKQLVDAAGHWYTNVPIKNRPKYSLLKLVPMNDIAEKYKTFDDGGALLVDNGYIPTNYNQPFGVSARSILNGVLELGYEIVQEKEYYPYINGKKKFSRVLIQKKE